VLLDRRLGVTRWVRTAHPFNEELDDTLRRAGANCGVVLCAEARTAAFKRFAKAECAKSTAESLDHSRRVTSAEAEWSVIVIVLINLSSNQRTARQLRE